MLEALATKEIGCPNSKEDLAEMCRELIAETENHPPSPDYQSIPASSCPSGITLWHMHTRAS